MKLAQRTRRLTADEETALLAAAGALARDAGVLGAYGREPEWMKGGKPSEESRAALAAINLHFHDLRHEAGSRWLEAGMPLHHINEILGHRNISQTDTYLNAGRGALQESMKRFAAGRGKPVAKPPTSEQRPSRHDDTEERSKDHLH